MAWRRRLATTGYQERFSGTAPNCQATRDTGHTAASHAAKREDARHVPTAGRIIEDTSFYRQLLTAHPGMWWGLEETVILAGRRHILQGEWVTKSGWLRPVPPQIPPRSNRGKKACGRTETRVPKPPRQPLRQACHPCRPVRNGNRLSTQSGSARCAWYGPKCPSL